MIRAKADWPSKPPEKLNRFGSRFAAQFARCRRSSEPDAIICDALLLTATQEVNRGEDHDLDRRGSTIKSC